jgi:NADH-quinone oxidoreductase subunit G
VGCNVTINTRREAISDGKVAIKRVMPRQNEAVNEIWMCDKGRFAHHFTESKDRLVKPQVRKNGKLETVTWKEAVAEAGRKLHGEKIIVLAGGRLSNEDLFNLKQLADTLNGQALFYTAMGGGELTSQVGVGQGTNFAEMGKGTTILVAASDLYNEAPLWYLRIKQAAGRGATLIVVNPRETRLEKYATHVVRYVYGDEAVTIGGLLKSKPGKVIADAITTAENLVVLYGSEGLGLEGSSALAVACANMLVETNHTGRVNNGLIGVWPHANDQAAWELGYKAETSLAEMLPGKVVYIAAADPAGDDPALEEVLKKAKYVIVQELFPTRTANLADMVLPAQAFIERDGSFTSGERRVQRFYPAVPPPGETRTDFSITAALAGELGIELEGRSAALVMDRIAASTRMFEGVSYRKLAEGTEQWPLIGRGDLYYGGTSYENKQGLGVQLPLATLTPISSPEQGKTLRPDEDQWLAVPVTRLYDRGIMVLTSRLLHQRIDGALIVLHPEMAKMLAVEAGEQIELNGNRLEVRLDPSVPASVALVPRSMGIPIYAPVAANLKKV